MITKGDIALAALEELVISGITSDPSPEEIVSTIKSLDNMVNSWKRKNVCLSYISSTSYNDVDPHQESGIADDEVFAVIFNLAKNICSKFGKPCPDRIADDAKEGLDNLYSIILPEKENRPYMPTGGGETYSYYNSLYHGFYNKYFPTDKNAPENCDTFDIKVGQVDIFSVDFNDYLLDGNTISSYTVEGGEGVKVLSHSQLDGIVTMECEGFVSGYATVKITVTSTPSGRINPEIVNFNVIAQPSFYN